MSNRADLPVLRLPPTNQPIQSDAFNVTAGHFPIVEMFQSRRADIANRSGPEQRRSPSGVR